MSLYKCPQCSRSFKHRSLLKRHARTHGTAFAFSCTKCERKFHRKDGLDVHLLAAHSDGKLFACDQCENSYNHRSSLRRHLRSAHTPILSLAAHKKPKFDLDQTHAASDGTSLQQYDDDKPAYKAAAFNPSPLLTQPTPTVHPTSLDYQDLGLATRARAQPNIVSSPNINNSLSRAESIELEAAHQALGSATAGWLATPPVCRATSSNSTRSQTTCSVPLSVDELDMLAHVNTSVTSEIPFDTMQLSVTSMSISQPQETLSSSLMYPTTSDAISHLVSNPSLSSSTVPTANEEPLLTFAPLTTPVTAPTPIGNLNTHQPSFDLPLQTLQSQVQGNASPSTQQAATEALVRLVVGQLSERDAQQLLVALQLTNILQRNQLLARLRSQATTTGTGSQDGFSYS
eukprot:m.140719 g.140719  ORF g.140719 m.140719 type:complete len:401 (+) comp16112_c0_seq2:2064-3266(+)